MQELPNTAPDGFKIPILRRSYRLPRLARGFDPQGDMGYDVHLRRRGAPVRAKVAGNSVRASERMDVATACPKENSDGSHQ